MKLSLPSRLGPLVAKHRPPVPKPLRALAQQAVLNRSAHHRGRSLRAQGATALASIQEGVHLLAHHIGGLTDPPGKELGDLEHRGADLLHAGPAELLAGPMLHPLPQSGLRRQQIHHAPKALQLLHAWPNAAASLQWHP